MDCPTCWRIKNCNGRLVVLAHPEEVNCLCEKHYKQLKEWHDEQVAKGFIKKWDNLG